MSNRLPKTKNDWEKAVSKKQVGYNDLLNNVNDLENTVGYITMNLALERLKDPEVIAREKPSVFSFYPHYKIASSAIIAQSLVKAADRSLELIPSYEGSTAVIVDTSGSMLVGSPKPLYRAAVVAASIFTKNDLVDILLASNRPKYLPLRDTKSVLTITDTIIEQAGLRKANLAKAIKSLQRNYKRIIFLSDAEAKSEMSRSIVALNNYKEDFSNKDLITHVVDVSGSTAHLIEGNITYSYNRETTQKEIFDIITILENRALESQVNKS